MNCVFLTVWDASAKVPVGLLTGTNTQLGNYDECLGVRSPLQSQYCLVTVMIQVPTGHDTLDPETEEYLPTSSAWDKIHVSTWQQNLNLKCEVGRVFCR